MSNQHPNKPSKPHRPQPPHPAPPYRPPHPMPPPRPPRPPHPPHPVPPPRPPHQILPPYRPQPPQHSGVDYGSHPFVLDINKATLGNENFRTVLWTGKHLQATLMKIEVGDDIGLEMHPNVDQFLRIEEGQALVMMGDSASQLNFRQPAFEEFAIFIPAGTWHNIINVGRVPLRLYSIYAPPNHPKGAIHATKAIAERMEQH